MTKRSPVSPAPGPLEDYAALLDDLFGARAQRHAFRRYLEGLLLPAERNKTLTALANTEPVVGAQRKEAQSLQWFLSESRWDPMEINERRLERLPGKKRPGHKTPLAAGVVCLFFVLVGVWALTSFFARGVGRDDKRRSSLRTGGKGKRRAGLTWPEALTAVRGWLEPWIMLGRYWKAYSGMPPPRELRALLDRVFSGRGLYLYVR